MGFSKAFDRVPVHILLSLASELGVSEGIVSALSGMYKQLKRRWKVGPFVGEEFESTNGILQGCPLSVVLLNMMVHIWVKAVEHHEPNAMPSAYADDLQATARTTRAVQKVLTVTKRFCQLTGMIFFGQAWKTEAAAAK